MLTEAHDRFGGEPAARRRLWRKTVETRIARTVGRARAALLWEQLWPLIAPFLVLAALFAALSWFGLWRITSEPVRWVILALFVVAIAGAAWRALRFAWPSRAAAFARVEQATGALHRPATAFTDRLASRPDDPTGQALWEAHRRRMLASLDALRAGLPAPRLAARDPYALRFLVLLLFVVGFVVAGPERIARLGEAFRGGESTAAAIARIDAWVTPPAYTGRAPIFLTGEAAKPPGTEYSVPVGSVVTVRTGGSHDLAVMASDGGKPAPVAPMAPKQAAAADAAAPLEHQVTLSRAGSVTIEKSGHEIAGWNFTVEPDNPPQIALVGEPHAEASGALALSYSLEDDYGIVAARGEITPLGDPTTGDARPLYSAPALPLSLPQLRVRDGTGQTIRDLTSHPWAGAKVKLTLVATDEAKQEGRQRPGRIHPAGPPLLQSARPRRGRAARAPGARCQRRDPRRRRARRAHRGAGQDRPPQQLSGAALRLFPPDPRPWRRRAARRGRLSLADRARHRGRRHVACRPEPARRPGGAAEGAGEQRLRRGDPEAHREPASGAQQVPAGARRPGAPEPAGQQPCRPMPMSRPCARRTCSA